MPPKKRARGNYWKPKWSTKGQMIGLDEDEVASFDNVIAVSQDGFRYVHSGQWRIACSHRGCSKRGIQGIEGDPNVYCKPHAPAGATDISSKTCNEVGCTKQPKWGIPRATKTIATKCGDHKTPDMVPVNRTVCKDPTCTHEASFGIDGKRTHCAKHRGDDMRAFDAALCRQEGCKKGASFGPEGGSRMWCGTHRKDGVINLNAVYCNEDDCNKIASFGVEGGKPQFCKAHKTEDMVDVASTFCPADNCKKQGSLSIDGKPPYYCATHAPDGAVPMQSKQCNDDGCVEWAIYGFKTDNKRLMCSKHATPDMQLVIGRFCKQDGCDLQASFGLQADGQVVACKIHKTDPMILLTRRRCEVDTCTKELWAADQTRCYIHGGGFPCPSPTTCNGRVAIATSWCGACQLRGSSRMERKCMELLCEKYGIDDMIYGDVQFTIPTTEKKADGYSAKLNTVFEYHGVYFHGYRNNANAEDIGFRGQSNAVMYQKTVDRMKLITDLGYRVVHVWGPSIADTATVDVLHNEVFEYVYGKPDTFLSFTI